MTVRLPMPPEVALGFGALQDLHDAVVGQERGPSALIDAMVGEAASAGWVLPDDLRHRLQNRFETGAASRVRGRRGERGVSQRGEPRGTVALDRTAGPGATPALRQAARTLDEFTHVQECLAHLESTLGPLKARSTSGVLLASKSRNRDIRCLLDVLTRLIRLQDSVEIAMANLLVEMHEDRAWRVLGFAGLESYAEECLGLGRSTVRRRVQLARRLGRLGSVRQVYESGQLGEEAALWVTRRMDGHDETSLERWIAHAQVTTIKRLRDEDSLIRRQALRGQIEVARTMTEKNDIRTARRVPRATSNEPPDDVTWHDSLRRLPGGTRHGIFDLGYGLLERIVRRGPLTEAHIVLRLTPAAAADLRGGMEAVRRAHTESAQTHLSVAEEGRLRPSERMARHFVLHGQRLPAWLGLLGWIEECAWSWDEPRSMPSRPHDRIYRRDGFRCMAPGCTARVRLEAHHLQYRSRGGEDLPENLLVLCLFHHQQGEHGLLARARGWAPLGVTWRLGNTELATWWRNERKLGAPTSPPLDPRSASRAIA